MQPPANLNSCTLGHTWFFLTASGANPETCDWKIFPFDIMVGLLLLYGYLHTINTIQVILPRSKFDEFELRPPIFSEMNKEATSLEEAREVSGNLFEVSFTCLYLIDLILVQSSGTQSRLRIAHSTKTCLPS